jgi:hypothetical protein
MPDEQETPTPPVEQETPTPPVEQETPTPPTLLEVKPAEDDGLRTPEEHARATNHLRKVPTFAGGTNEGGTPEYRAAAVLHGWTTHKLHTATPLRISTDDFKAALKASHEADESGNYKPHSPACSPYCPFVA